MSAATQSPGNDNPVDRKPASSPCGCLVRFLEISNGDAFEALARVQVAGLAGCPSICSFPCGAELRTVVVAERAKALRRPFMTEWRRAYCLRLVVVVVLTGAMAAAVSAPVLWQGWAP